MLLVAQIFPTGTPAGQCNADLPNTSTYQRFLHVVQVSPPPPEPPILSRLLCSHASTVQTRLRSISLQPKPSAVPGPMLTAALAAQFMARNGFYVLIDNHFEDTTILTNPTQWVDDWSGLMADIVKDSVAAGRVLVDLYNEPDSHGLTWSTVRPRS